MSVGKDMLADIKLYATENVRKAEEIAKDVQKQMKKEIKPITPYRDYSKTGPEDRVARDIAAKKGHLKDKWGVGQIKAKNKGSAILNLDGKYYGVRSLNKPMLVHLLNFPHKIVLWGHPTNRMSVPKDRHKNPVQWVDQISEKGQNELDARLKKYFEVK